MGSSLATIRMSPADRCNGCNGCDDAPCGLFVMGATWKGGNEGKGCGEEQSPAFLCPAFVTCVRDPCSGHGFVARVFAEGGNEGEGCGEEEEEDEEEEEEEEEQQQQQQEHYLHLETRERVQTSCSEE